MKRIQVTPLKDINGVSFGDTQTSVRRAFGRYTESKGIDDFGWCKVHYDGNRRMDAVELNLNECTVTIGSKTINSRDNRATRNVFGMPSNIDRNRNMMFTESVGGGISKVTFNKKGSNYLFESDDKDHEKELTEVLGKDGAKKQLETEKNQQDQNMAAMKASSDKVKNDVRNAIGDNDKSSVKKEDGGESLLQFYDDLKNRLNSDPAEMSHQAPMRVAGGVMAPTNHPGTIAYRNMMHHEHDKLHDGCCKHILVDMYCKILPLDQSFINGHMGMMKQDVDCMLAAKGMTPSQYLTSCSEATKAPLLEFIVRNIDNIGKQFLEAAKEKLEDAQEQEIEVDPPEAPDPDAPPQEEDDVASQLVDIKKDTEYENFIDKLKEKTIKKIVADVTKIINDKKEDNEMAFDPKPVDQSISDIEAQTESTISIALQYLQKNVFTESHHQDMTNRDNNIFGGKKETPMQKETGSDQDPDKLSDIPHKKKPENGGTNLGQDNSNLTEEIFESDMTDHMIGLAIREATLNELDRCFEQRGSSFKEFATRVRLGKGYIINKPMATAYIESMRNH